MYSSQEHSTGNLLKIYLQEDLLERTQLNLLANTGNIWCEMSHKFEIQHCSVLSDLDVDIESYIYSIH